ncbi:MAG: hypothetical protein ABI843_01520 [Dokdonella sp.]
MIGNFRTTALRSACMLALAAVSPAAFADPSPALDRVSLWLGGYYLDTDVALKASTPAGDISTGKVDLESGHETVGRARLDFLLFDNQGLTFDYYTLSHSTAQTLAKPFDYAGIPFELDSTLRGKLDFTAGSASYHWWFGEANDVFGIGLGCTYYKAKLGIDGRVALGGQSAAASARWDDDAVAPLITLAYKHAFSDELRVYLDASGVKKSGGKLSGHIYDARAGVEWFPWHNVGVGAEYGYTRIHLDHNGDSYDANLDIKLDGPAFFARYRF